MTGHQDSRDARRTRFALRHVNGQTGYRFRVDACDNAEPGAGMDTFGIHVTGPGGFAYSKGPAPITDGNIQSH